MFTKSMTIDGVPETALKGSMRDFRVMEGADLLGRCNAFYDWQDNRRQSGTWPFSRSTETGPASSCAVRDDSGNLTTGVNFASQDYLSLSSHPEVLAAAKAAIDEFGVHSAGSPALVGNTSTSVALERRLAHVGLSRSDLGVELIRFGRHDEIVAVQPLDLVRPPGHGDAAPFDQHDGMVTFILGQHAHLLGEGQCLEILGKPKRPLDFRDAVLIEPVPVGHFR